MVGLAGRRPLKLAMVGHSYCVALNRRLCQEVAREGQGQVEVTVAAPAFMHGDLRPIHLEAAPRAEPYELVAVPTYGSRLIHVFLYGRRLAAFLRGPWDLIHAWEEPYILAGAQIALLADRRAALVYSSYQNLSKRYPPPFGWTERYCLARAAGWVGGGRTIVDTLLTRPGYADRPHRLIPLGVDVEAFRPDPAARARTLRELGWSDAGPPVVGYLGRFVEEKGVDLVRRALDRLPRGTWRALFVGGGRLEPELRAWAARQGDAVRIVTGVPHDGVPRHLNAMDLLTAPSQTTPRWREQVGRMLLEGMASGLCLVASDSGEIPHVVADAGRVVAEADEDAWVAELGRMIDSPALRAELAARGLDRARTTYAWSVIARQLIDFFVELHEAKPRPSPRRRTPEATVL